MNFTLATKTLDELVCIKIYRSRQRVIGRSLKYLFFHTFRETLEQYSIYRRETILSATVFSQAMKEDVFLYGSLKLIDASCSMKPWTLQFIETILFTAAWRGLALLLLNYVESSLRSSRVLNDNRSWMEKQELKVKVKLPPSLKRAIHFHNQWNASVWAELF